MIVELNKNLYKNETIKFIKRLEKSMCIRFFELIAHDKYKFCDRQKNYFES
jgi:hypothetical protein